MSEPTFIDYVHVMGAAWEGYFHSNPRLTGFSSDWTGGVDDCRNNYNVDRSLLSGFSNINLYGVTVFVED